MELILAAAVAGIATALGSFTETVWRYVRDRWVDRGAALRVADEAVKQAEIDVLAVEPPAAEDEASVEETADKIRTHFDETLAALDSLRSRMGSDIERLRAQVSEERMALDVLSAQAQERRLFIEMSEDPARLAEHLNTQISKQTELIRSQSNQVGALQDELSTMRRRATISGRWNLVLTILLAIVSTALGLYPILWD